MISISDLNRRERVVRKTLSDIEKKFRGNRISKTDYNSQKRVREGELKGIELERKSIIAKLPPIPPPPKPSGSSARTPTSTAASAESDVAIELKRQEKDILFTQSEMSKLFAEVVKNRERVRSIENMVKNLGSAKPQAANIDTKVIDDRITSQIQNMNKTVMDNISKNRDGLDRMTGDINNTKREVEELKNITGKLDSMDVSGLRRDIESLKERNKWLEQQINSLDIEPLYELIKEIEDRMSREDRGTVPVIIE